MPYRTEYPDTMPGRRRNRGFGAWTYARQTDAYNDLCAAQNGHGAADASCRLSDSFHPDTSHSRRSRFVDGGRHSKSAGYCRSSQKPWIGSAFHRAIFSLAEVRFDLESW